MKYLVGIDNGGTFSKTALFDEKGKQLASATVPTQTLTPKPGYAQRDMNELWKVNAKSIKRAIEESGVDPERSPEYHFPDTGKGCIWSEQTGNRHITDMKHTVRF